MQSYTPTSIISVVRHGRPTVIECNLSFPLLAQNSFYQQLFKQKKSERFFKVFYDRMRLAQQEIRATVSVNMFELSSRKRDDDGGDANTLHLKKGTLHLVTIHRLSRVDPISSVRLTLDQL